MLKPSLQLRVGQHLTMTPQLQQAIPMLQLPILELNAQLQQMLESNVMLEAEEPAEREAEIPVEAALGTFTAEQPAAKSEEAPEEFQYDPDESGVLPDEAQDLGLAVETAGDETDVRGIGRELVERGIHGDPRAEPDLGPGVVVERSVQVYESDRGSCRQPERAGKRNTTLALALITMVMVQVFGVRALGGKYFFKFVNIPELRRGGLGYMMFIVGFLELISEIARILSFTFRLLGNMFAGGVLLLVMTFIVPFFIPMPFLGLELFVGFIQALVFAMLALVFMNMAMASHGDHGDEHL